VGNLLFVEKWPVEGRTHSADTGMSIGRAECDIILPDPDVSRRHAVICLVNGSLAVEDAGSKNGTYVNGRRIEAATVLANGDEVRFGHTVWRVQSALNRA
jgi:pSer/pThr/pTyr-binding forkhead associated (FHA) protein